MHDPDRADAMDDARRRGGRHRPTYKLSESIEANFARVDLALDTPLGLQASLEAVMRMVMLGRIPRTHATLLMRFFEVAVRTLPRLPYASSATRRDYFEQMSEILFASDLIEDHLEAQDTHERATKLSDLRARLEERFRTEDNFGRTPKPAPSRPAKSTSSGPNSSWDQW
jgi:hypothetical protein